MSQSLIAKQWIRVIRLYHRIRSSWLIWFYVLNLKGHHLFKKNDSYKIVTETEKEILESLKNDGIAVIEFEKLFSKERLEILKKYVLTRRNSAEIEEKISSRKHRPESRGDKYYNIDLWPSPKFLELKNPLVQFFLDRQILKIANCYFELYSKFRGWNLWASMPIPENQPEHASQNWHRDPEDKKMLKVFVYYNDIDLEAGPFTYVKKSHYGGKWRSVFPQIPPIGFYPPRGAVEKIVDPKDIFQATGKTGTIIFCDTSGLHKGGYCKTNERLMSQSIYGSSASLEPRNYQSTEIIDEKLPDEVRFALS